MNGIRQQGWRWAVAAIVLANCLIYAHLAKKIAVLQESVATVESRLASSSEARAEIAKTDTSMRRRALPDVPAPTFAPAAPTVPTPTGDATTDAINRIRQIKQQKSSVDPLAMAADLSNRMTEETPAPEAEQRHSSWLKDTFQRMPTDAPDAGSLQTTCVGQRCLVSAAFASEGDARDWSTRYLLEGGGRLLRHSSTVIVPLGGPDQSVALQLYLY